MTAAVEGWRDPKQKDPLPDVTLTGDEFAHLLAVTCENVPGSPAAHKRSTVRGFFDPGCPACDSIVAKFAAFTAEAGRRGVVPGIVPPQHGHPGHDA